MTIAPDDPSAWRHRGQLVEALQAYRALAPGDAPPRLAEWLTLPEAELPLAEIARVAAADRDAVLEQLSDIRSELEELGALVGRNREVAAQLAEQVVAGQRQMHETLRSFEAARRIVLKQGTRLLADLSPEQVERALAPSQDAIQASHTTAGLTRAILDWHRQAVDLYDKASLQASQLQELVETVYSRFQDTPAGPPPPLTLERGRVELLALGQRIESFFRGTLNLISTKASLLKRFAAGPAAELPQVFAQGQLDAEAWLKGALLPLLTQIREAQVRLEKRGRDEGKIRDYLKTLEARMEELEQLRSALQQRQAGLERILSALQNP